MITPDHIKISVHILVFGQSIKLNDALKISKYFFKYCLKIAQHETAKPEMKAVLVLLEE
jgi:hypothetical protein